MRDIIWTIIVVWLVWRVIDAFRSFSQRTSGVNSHTSHSNRTYTNENAGQTNTDNHSETPKKGHLKPDAGEYVDYEETK